MSASAKPFPPRRVTSRAASLGVLAVAGLAVLCTTSAAAPVTQTGTTVVVTVGTPKETSVKLSKSSGLLAGSVVFQVTNRGKAQHTFVVCSNPVSGLVNACSGKSVTLTKTGQTAKLTVRFKKGKYEFLSIVSGQSVSGTKGAIGVGLSVPIAISSIPKSGGGSTTTGTGSGSGSGSGAGTGSGSAGGLPVFPAGNAKNGPAVFGVAGCGTCHTLKDAGSTGGGGPDLDDLMPSLGDVENQVYNGGGGMPPFGGQLTNQQIADVAAYVSSVT